MRWQIKVVFIIFVLAWFLSGQVQAKQVYVKYRGSVETNNGHFNSYNLKPSSFVQEIFYDAPNHYLLVSLNGTYYHYCGVPESVVGSWVAAPSLGRFYNRYVKGNYDCRTYLPPRY